VIRHHAVGRGHPYRIEPDQRVPVRPSSGEAFELRAVTSAGVRGLRVELEHGGERVVLDAGRRGTAQPEEIADWGVRARSVGQGHLTGLLEEGAGDGLLAWSAAVAPLGPGDALRYRFHGGGETTRWHELRACAWSGDGGTLVVDGDVPRLLDGSVRWLTDGGRTYAARFALRLERGEHVVGFGERFDGVDQRGRRVDAVVFDQYKGQGARTYLPVPFAIVVGGDFGFHVDTGHRVRFDVGATTPDELVVEVDLEPGESQPQVTLRLFAGGPAAVLRQFVERSGGAAIPPDWVYRLWLSGNEWKRDARIREELRRADEAEIPVGVVVIEAWSDEETFVAFNGAQYDVHDDGAPHRYADFRFPDDGPWPDPQRLVDDLHERGAKVVLWQIPLAGSHPGQAAADVDTMVERAYCVADADGAPYRNPGGWFRDALLLDFTNDEATRWWLEKRRYLVEEVGVDGFKTDGGEHAWSPELRYADGTRGGETNNRYPVLYARAYHELVPVTFSRAGFTGAAAVPCHWAGDADSTWEAFRASISAGITAGASGISFWGWDLGGFSGPLPSVELYLRAAATACLCPIMQVHSEFGSPDRTPWNVAEQTGSPDVVRIFRRFVRLRERLVPYLAEQARTGLPLMRALFFEVDDDERIWDFPEQYFLGDSILVAPVTRPGVARQQVYVPPGEWIDPATGDALHGPAVADRPAPLDAVPALVAPELVRLFVEASRTLEVV
jgi:alpha-glucosidase (family GH31 glycosyl hydrolase)